MSEPSASLYIELRALVSKFSSDLDTASKKITGFETGVGTAFKNLQRVTQAAIGVAAVYSVKQLTDAVAELAAEGDKAGDIADNFKRLGGISESIDKARKAVLGTVGAFDLMGSANKGLAAGVTGFDKNFDKIAELGARAADAFGHDAGEEIDKLSGLIAKGSKKLGEYGFQLDGIKGKSEKWKAIMEQLPTVMERFNEISDSVNNAIESLNNTMSDGMKEVGIAINGNKDLTTAYRDLEETMSQLDFGAIGDGLAGMQTGIVNLANSIAQVLVPAMNEFMRGWNYLTGSGVQGQLDGIAAEITKKQERLQLLTNPRALISKREWAIKEASELTTQIEDLKKKFSDLRIELPKAEEGAKGVAEGGFKPLGKTVDHTAEKLAKLREKLSEKWDTDALKRGQQSIEDEIKKAIEAANQADFSNLIQKFKDAVKVGFTDEYKEQIEQGITSKAQVEAAAESVAETHAQAYRDEMKKAVDDIKNKMTEAYSQSFDQLIGSLNNLGNSLGFDLSGLSNSLSTMMSDDTKAGIMSGIAEAFGMVDASGNPMVAAVADYLNGAMTTIGSIFSAKGLDKQNKDNRGTGAAIGSAIGLAVGGSIGAEIGKLVGGEGGKLFKWGSQNPETQARHAFANWFEDQVKQLKTISFFDNKGQLQVQDAQRYNFLEGDTGKFNQPGWANEMDAWSDNARSTFGGLATALKEINGLVDANGGQIAYMLGTQLGANVDNARLMVQQLGLSFDTLSEAIFKAARSGDISWQKYSIDMAGLGEAFKPGLEKIAALNEAWEEFVASGGRGVAALKGAKDIGQEALEAGAKTFDEARDRLIAMGKDPEQVTAFFDALKQRGIDTFEELAKAEEQLLGAAVGDAGNNSAALSAKWEAVTESLEKYKTALEEIPDEKNIRITATAELDENARLLLNSDAMRGGDATISSSPGSVQKFARGGIINGSTLFEHSGGLGLAGENPGHAEAVFPLTRVGGKLSIIGESGGGRSGNTIYMDLRGAQQGVGAEVERVMGLYAPIIVQQAVDASYDIAARHMGG